MNLFILAQVEETETTQGTGDTEVSQGFNIVITVLSRRNAEQPSIEQSTVQLQEKILKKWEKSIRLQIT